MTAPTERMVAIIGLDPGELMTGDMLTALDDDALAAMISMIRVFAEVEPQQKERVVRALQSADLAVGYIRVLARSGRRR